MLSSLRAFALADPFPGLLSCILSIGWLLYILQVSVQPSLLEDIALPLAKALLTQPVTRPPFLTALFTSYTVFNAIILTCLFTTSLQSYPHTS